MRLILLLTLLLAVPAHASRSAGGVMISGTDEVCSSYTAATSGSTTTYTCVPAGTNPGAPTNCLATVNSASTVNFGSAGGTAILNVVCNQTSGVAYNWRRNGSGVSTQQTFNDVLPSNGGGSPVNYTYQVAACISSACVTVPASPLVATVAPSGGTPSACPGFDNTILLTANWGSPTRLFSGPMGANDIVVIQFTTGNVATTGSLVRIAAAEYQSSPSARTATLSSSPCDFSTQAAPGSNVPNSNSPTVSFAITPGSGFGFYAVLAKNTTYYMNIKNVPNSTCTASGICNLFADLIKPGGV